MSYKIQLNLSRGENYMKWKITDRHGIHKYYDPSKVVLKLKECTLHNNLKGGDKFVVAWVEAEDVIVLHQRQLEMAFEQVRYNPKVSPHWTINDEVVDGQYFEVLVSINNELFLQ